MRRLGLRGRIALSYLATSALITCALLGFGGAVLLTHGLGSPHFGFALPLRLALAVTAVLVLVVAPIGATVGVLTMRGTVTRLAMLLEASRALAQGDFSRRVEPRGSDEVTELQRQFNAMAEQLEDALNRQRKLTAENVRLEERSRIARDLHDSVSQDLFSIRMLLAGLGVRHADDRELSAQLAALNTSANDSIRVMRALLLELRPPTLDGLDLAAGLHELAETFGSRLEINVQAHVDEVSLGAPAEQALLRVAQEALANAARHSGADRVDLGLTARDGIVQLRVTDNGRGFAPETERRGLGLRIVEERVRDLDGDLRLESGPGRGTDLIVTVPLARDAVL